MRRTQLSALGAACAAALVTGLLAPPAAQADVWSKKDGKDANLAFVRIDNAPRKVFLEARFHEKYGVSGTVWKLDTVRRHRGPEFEVTMAIDNTEEYTLYRVGKRSKDVRCRGLKGRSRDSQRIDVTVPRTCLTWKGRLPDAISMQVEHRQYFVGDDFNDIEYDYAPGGRRDYGPWVAHN